MILPGSQLYNLILLAFGMLCLGTWANTFRMTTRWRFELYYFDFAIGAVVAAVLVGLTFGSLGWDGFALADDFRIAGKQKEALALGGGMIFNLGNTLILAALSISGVTVAYMIGVATMLTTGFIITFFTSPSGNGTMVFAGAVLILVAGVLLGVAYWQHSIERLLLLAQQGKTKSTRKQASLKGVFLAVAGGIIAGAYFPLMNASAEGENGAGPYTMGIFFSAGIAVSTVVYSMFFMNLPVYGQPVELGAYFKGKAKFHWLGVLGGMMFYVALISTLVQMRAEGKNVVPPVTMRALTLGAVLIGTLWGLLRWKEFEGASGKIKTMLFLALFLLVSGMVALSGAPGMNTSG